MSDGDPEVRSLGALQALAGQAHLQPTVMARTQKDRAVFWLTVALIVLCLVSIWFMLNLAGVFHVVPVTSDNGCLGKLYNEARCFR